LGKKDDAYKDDFVPQYYNLLGQYYNDRGGPYLLGDKVTYADFAVYQSIDNDARTGTLPVGLSISPHSHFTVVYFYFQSTLPESLLKFKETFEQRPNIASYLKSRKPVS
jgi:glutathione S-transferase